jgi:hypothetical protein
MGYTHYWRCHPGKLNNNPAVDQTLEEMRRAAHASGVPLDWEGDVPGKRLALNGVGDDSCETFDFPPSRSSDFCKTNGHPYDVVVTACLAIAKHRLGDDLEVSSDGETDDWARGVALASKILGEPVKCPLG